MHHFLDEMTTKSHVKKVSHADKEVAYLVSQGSLSFPT